MVSCSSRATTSCVVLKEKTQTRITFNNLSANLTVRELYKYVQLHLDEARPFELALLLKSHSNEPSGGGGCLGAKSQKVSLEDKKQKTLLAAGLNFDNGAANTVLLISSADACSNGAEQLKFESNHVQTQPEEQVKPAQNGINHKLPKKLEKTPSSNKMGIPCETSDAVTNGTQKQDPPPAPPPSETAANGHVTPTQELNDFSRQITINTNSKCPEDDDDPAPLISPINFSPRNESSFVPDPPPFPAIEYPSTSTNSSSDRVVRLQTSPMPSGSNFVGLVNQAMTCYLNSLLQALYMTPEFRNAMYNWEFDGHEETKSIPYQLQRLFLNLQTSSKSAVETTDLTRSFGWDSSEAWQQHDIQELCRVMFDALEHKFKNTKEADLINRLYEGKMIDYLKCLSCGIEKQREDTFLDIPLPVKPFGSNVAFESIEEALRAFIQPEILNGNNQYSCETCQKKCDAHKGLKFSKFPYILTLHLKRFDFDYQTFHRIKLNDKVTFPQTLNLNGFVNTSTELPAQNGAATNGAAAGENGTASNGISGEEEVKENGHTPMEVDEGEGDGEKIPEATHKFGSHSGPYMYELFAIMIHSGSASGGHYYVYIKDFESGNWFCFNDQCVSSITQEDIQKSFGGSSGRYHYSGAYTTSTNAYMLMYRQLDGDRNILPTGVDELPEHIKLLQKKLKDRQEVDTRRRNTTDYTLITTRVYHYDQERCTLSDVKIHISGDYYLDELLQRSYDRMNLATQRSLNLCRLVAFDHRTQTTLASIEHHDQTLLQDVLEKYPDCDFLLEERDRDEKFKAYTGEMVNARVYVVDLRAGDVDGPHRVPIRLDGTVAEMKQEICDALKGNKCLGELRVALYKTKFAVILDNDKDLLKLEVDPTELCPVKLFVASFPEGAQSRVEQFDKRFKRTVERFDRVLSVYFKVPEVTVKSRKLHSIPEYKSPEPIEEVQVKEEKAPEVKKEVEVEIKKEAEGKKEDSVVPMELSPEQPMKQKSLSPTPEFTSSNTESASPSPEPPEVRRKKSTTTTEVRKKSLSVQSGGEAKEKEKSPVRRETVETKEKMVDGVLKKVRVVRRVVKKDPTKKVAEVSGGGDEDQQSSPPVVKLSTAEPVAPENKTPTKVIKKVKVAVKTPTKEAENATKAPPAQTLISNNKSVPEEAVKSPPAIVVPEIVTAPALLPVDPPTKPEIVLDLFSYLDVEEVCENGNASAVQYFRAIPKKKSISEQNGSIADDEMRLIQVHVDKSMTINALKTFLEPVLEVSKDYFKVNRSMNESMRLNDTLSSLSDGEQLLIELGRILQDGEYKYKVGHLKLSEVNDYTEELAHLCDYIVRNEQKVGEVKEGILQYLKENGNNSIADRPPEKYRLWTKLYQSLGQVCTDDLILGDDISLRRNAEFVLEEIEEGIVDPVTDCDDFVIFTRKWNPDTLILEPYQGVTLPAKSELMAVLSKKSGIAVENLEYTRHMLPFPRMKISKVGINGDMDWKSEPIVTSLDTSRNGHVYFYRDKTVPYKEPAADEIATITREESEKREAAKAALNGCADQNGGGGGSGDSLMATTGDSGSSSYTVAKNRRKEKALKIYLDSSPVKAVTS